MLFRGVGECQAGRGRLRAASQLLAVPARGLQWSPQRVNEAPYRTTHNHPNVSKVGGAARRWRRLGDSSGVESQRLQSDALRTSAVDSSSAIVLQIIK